MRQILYTAAYQLMWSLRRALPQTAALRNAEFTTIRQRVIEVTARAVEPKASAVKLQPVSQSRSPARSPMRRYSATSL
jgi:hypothetical protein